MKAISQQKSLVQEHEAHIIRKDCELFSVSCVGRSAWETFEP
ncbi:hypothetical protein CIP107532_00373 [Corynebacterium diphtheriae]|nr:hypothetical protein CIP107532_00373 [Corynebacterium diphtheriae]